MAERVDALNMRITFTDKLKTFLVDKGTDLKYGARPLRRTIQRFIENPLAEQILKGTFDKGDDIEAIPGEDEDGDPCAVFKIVGKIDIKEEAPQELKAEVVVAKKQKKSSDDPTQME